MKASLRIMVEHLKKDCGTQEKQDSILSLNSRIMERVDMFGMDIAFHTDPIDIDQYLPVKSNDTILSFLSNDDGLLDQRKKSFFRRLYAHCNFTDNTHFVKTFCSLTFDTTYMINHRLPHQRYLVFLSALAFLLLTHTLSLLQCVKVESREQICARPFCCCHQTHA